MPSFQDSAVLVILALLLFGPKKLPVLARQLGKLMADFRRASNEFRTQMEEELRIAEQADRQKQIAAIEVSATTAPVTNSEPDQPHLPPPAPTFLTTPESPSSYEHQTLLNSPSDSATDSPTEPAPAPRPIASSGELSILPPPTGLPIANSEPASGNAIAPTDQPELETETLHG
jgi:sec-independent protein translocase protein TatB